MLKFKLFAMTLLILNSQISFADVDTFSYRFKKVDEKSISIQYCEYHYTCSNFGPGVVPTSVFETLSPNLRKVRAVAVGATEVVLIAGGVTIAFFSAVAATPGLAAASSVGLKVIHSISTAGMIAFPVGGIALATYARPLSPHYQWTRSNQESALLEFAKFESGQELIVNFDNEKKAKAYGDLLASILESKK